MAAYRFVLSGVTVSEEDPLGIWDVPVGTGVAFSVGDGAPEAPTWRVRLPESPETAQAILAAQMQALTLGQQDLARAQRELLWLGVPGEIAFRPSDELQAHRDTLLAALGELGSPVSYSLKLREDAEEQETSRQWHAFVEQVRQLVAHYARVETAMAGALAGLTTVDWKGDFKTTWSAGLDLEAMQVHLRAVQLALASRTALMRVVSVVASGAAGLAVKAMIPGGQLMLLPAVWRFVRDVLKELRQSWPQVQR
jgi:hypothetical protein